MTLTEYARDRGIQPQAVSRYLSRHPEIAKLARKTRGGRSYDVTPELIDALKDKYPLPSEIVTRDPEQEKEIQALKDRLLQAQQTIIDLQGRLIDAEVAKGQLDDKQQQIDNLTAQAADLTAQNAELTAKMDKINSASLLDRIRKKW